MIATEAIAQKFAWANAYSGADGDGSWATSVAVGDNENVFVCGRFDHELNLKGFQLKSTGTDGFVAKLDSSGNTLWARALVSTTYSSFSEIAIDEAGDIYAIGDFIGTLYIADATLTGEWHHSVLVKYNGAGDLLWYKSFPGRAAFRVKTDNNGNVYAMGSDYRKGLSIHPDTWLAKFDRDGEQIFDTHVAKSSDPNFFIAARLSVDLNENIYVSGLTGEHALFGDISYTGNKNGAFVLVKCNPAGVPEWVRVAEDVPSGGAWYTATIVNDGFGNTYYHTHNDILSLTKFDSDGNKLWTKRNENIAIGIQAISIDEQGNLLTTGQFSGDFTLDRAKFDSDGQTVFVAKFSDSGECLWALHGSTQQNDYAFSLARSRQTGALFIGGILNSPSSKFGEFGFPGGQYRLNAYVLKVQADSKPVKLDLGEDATICEGNSFTASANEEFLNYAWNTGATEPTLNITEPGLYILKAYDKSGYPHKDSVRVERCFESLIPNVITPNSDPHNEYFVIEALDLTKTNALFIFNRWGEKVYSDHRYENNWNGSELPTGTYFYELFNGADRKFYKGWVQIVR